jgi:DNA-binding NarL/FixJ family response regulator
MPNTASPTPSKVMIVDDHAAFRASARHLLESEGLNVIAEAETGEGALEALESATCDILLLDVHLPGIDGFEVARSITDRGGQAPAIVLVSNRELNELGVDRVAACGARGFVAKHSLSREAIDTLCDCN